MNVNFLKLNMDKSQLLMCGKKRIINSYQSQMADLNTALQISSDVFHRDMPSRIRVLIDTRPSIKPIYFDVVDTWTRSSNVVSTRYLVSWSNFP